MYFKVIISKDMNGNAYSLKWVYEHISYTVVNYMEYN